ncbi:MAG: hypothetical protein QXO16_06885 [Archaeoglobaceae archaeon]
MKYLIFPEQDLEKLLNELKGVLKPTFRRSKNVEILAEGDGVLLGKYRSILFLISNFETLLIPIAKFEIALKTVEKGENFAYGKYRIEEVIEIETEFDKELFYDLLPALFSEIAIARATLRDCFLTQSHIAEKMSKVRDLIKKEAKNLESYAIELARERDSFFIVYSNFVAKVDEAETSIASARFFVERLGGFIKEEVARLENSAKVAKKFAEECERVLREIENRFNMIYLQIEMERRKEEFEIGKKTSAITAAAVVIEFVAVAYYSLKIWESYLPIEKLPRILSFSLLMSFTLSVVFLTEAIGSYLKEKRIKKLFLSSAILASMLALMIILPLYYQAVAEL